MNFYDSGRMADLLKTSGFEVAEAVDGADLVILNTCHIREKAAEKVYSELGRIRKEKDRMKNEEGRKMVLAVAGCVAQAEGKEIIKRAPFVDIVVGPQAYQRLPQMVANANDAKGVELDFAADDKFDVLPEESDAQGSSAFLTIQEGCDKFCTFCVVPYTRGEEFSRSASEVMREAKKLVEQGSKEITLLGQNVNAYHGKWKDGSTWSLGRLAKELAELEGLERIRYTTSHPRDMDEELIKAHGEVEKLMPFIHLPIQSGSDRILKEMNRKHKAEDYLRLVDRLKASRPDIELSSDFIVGFPGETDEDFRDTLKLVEQVGYAQAYSFKYSPRAGTPAAIREDSIPEEVKSKRLAELQALLNKQQEEFNKSTIGRVLPVLLDREGKFEGQLVGRSPYMQAVHVVDDKNNFGKMVNVKIERAFANSVSGRIVEDSQDVEKIAAAL